MAKKNPLSNASRPETYLYTKGGEFSLQGENYVGEYHFLDKKPYTEPTHSNTSQQLTKFYTDKRLYIYDHLKDFKNLIDEYKEPIPIRIRVELLDYSAGYVQRHFVEKAFGSDRYPIEIDFVQAQNYNKPKSINGGLYNLATINWKLTGPLNNRYDDRGMLLEKGIQEHNALEVERISPKITNISYVIKNFIEFARPR